MDNWAQDDFLDFQQMKISSPSQRNQGNNPYSSNTYDSPQPQYHSYNVHSPSIQTHNFNNQQFSQQTEQNQVVRSNSSNNTTHVDIEVLQQLKLSMTKMMSMLERLEQRMCKVESTTNQILKTQQETLQVPFMSQSEIDKARTAAEQLEQDTNVAKQLQAAYNKEVEVRKSKMIATSSSSFATECPICGLRVNQLELESHVDTCLAMLSNDPKKEQETKKKIEATNPGFFSRFLKKTKTTETTKVTTTESATAPLLTNNNSNSNSSSNSMNSGEMQNYYHSQQSFGNYPVIMMPPPNSNGNQVPMMMPMYMYQGYPSNDK